MTDCIGAIDQGTQSTRFILYRCDTAEVLGSHTEEFEQHRQKPGWLEHDPQELLATVRTCITKALEATQEACGQLCVKAVGLTNQRETTIVWDRTTKAALHSAIVWPDSRNSAICSRIQEQVGGRDHFLGTTGLPVSTYFSAYKFRWLVEHVPRVQQAVQAGTCLLGTVDAWLLHNLTGEFVTDVTNAARTNLMELRTLAWHAPSLELFGVRPDMLPRICSNAQRLGSFLEGPLTGVPITGCLGDQHAAMLGQQCLQHQAKNTYGTGCFVMLHTGHEPVRSQHGLITTLACQLGPEAPVQYALEGAIGVGGSGISWLRDSLGVLSSAAGSEGLAASVPSTEGVYFVPAFSGLLAPRWRPDARGSILGISSATTKAHIVRAMLEAICWQTKEVMDAMTADVGLEDAHCLRVDGGASTNDLLMQLQADLLQVDVERPDNLETTALGAAYAAGIGAGIWTPEWVLQHRTTARQGGQLRRTFQPQASADSVAQRYQRWRKAVERSLDLDDLVDET